MRSLFVLCFTIIIASCSSTKQVSKINSSSSLYNGNQNFNFTEISTDQTYGYSEKNAVQTGGGPSGERQYLNALAGPNGEMVSYNRSGSCCQVKSNNGFNGVAVLDIYRVTWEGSKDTVSIYINMYDAAPLKAPVGFTIKK